jgi:hypothetical protein
VLAIVGCGRGTGEKGLIHEEVVAVNECVMEKAIDQPDNALMMIERLRVSDGTSGMRLMELYSEENLKASDFDNLLLEIK